MRWNPVRPEHSGPKVGRGGVSPFDLPSMSRNTSAMGRVSWCAVPADLGPVASVRAHIVCWCAADGLLYNSVLDLLDVWYAVL
jgi:hypothetical protein